MSDEKPCSRCGDRPRRGKHAWCGPCQNEARKTKRVTNDATNAVTNDQRGETPLAVARAEVEALRAEVAMLKRQLAQANARPVAVGSREPVDAIGVSLAAGVGKVCMHGARNCQALVCRASR